MAYLRKGSKGPQVLEFQKNLLSLGYSLGKYGADGDFGKDTLLAVKKFQEDFNIQVDGVVGPETLEAINEGLKSLELKKTYRVRKTWKDGASQIGAYKILAQAKIAAEKLGPAYGVFDSTGKEVYRPSDLFSGTLPIAQKYNGVMVGSSSKDERGRFTGGQAGDQTKAEVYVRDWYAYNWTHVLRPKKQALAEKIARACEAGCANDKIGYNQAARNTLYIEAKKVGLDLSKVTTPCDCDCSSFVSICCICAGLPEKPFYPYQNMCTTFTLKDACEITGEFEILTGSQYTNQKDNLKRGDILLNRNAHVVIVLSNGSNIQDDSAKVGVLTSYNGTVNATLLNVRQNAGSNYPVVGMMRKNDFCTIVEEKGGWGKLASGQGWVMLKYISKT